jgi:hypothetical protein
MLVCTYSYSSTGSAFGWAIGEATATDPPAYVVDCRARMSTVSITPGPTRGGSRASAGDAVDAVAGVGGRVAAAWWRREQEAAGARLT